MPDPTSQRVKPAIRSDEPARRVDAGPKHARPALRPPDRAGIAAGTGIRRRPPGQLQVVRNPEPDADA